MGKLSLIIFAATTAYFICVDVSGLPLKDQKNVSSNKDHPRVARDVWDTVTKTGRTFNKVQDYVRRLANFVGDAYTFKQKVHGLPKGFVEESGRPVELYKTFIQEQQAEAVTALKEAEALETPILNNLDTDMDKLIRKEEQLTQLRETEAKEVPVFVNIDQDLDSLIHEQMAQLSRTN